MSQYARFSQGILSKFLKYLGFWIYQSYQSILETTLIQLSGENLKSKMFEVYMTWHLNYFTSFEQYSFPASFQKEFWEIIRHPRYCQVHYPVISSNISNAIYFRATHAAHASTPNTLPRWHSIHVTHAGASLILSRQPLNPD